MNITQTTKLKEVLEILKNIENIEVKKASYLIEEVLKDAYSIR